MKTTDILKNKMILSDLQAQDKQGVLDELDQAATPAADAP